MRALLAVAIALGALSLCALTRRPLAAAPQAKLSEADELFRQELWAEARAAYDAAAKTLNLPQFRKATRGAVEASLRLKDWTGALDRTVLLIPKTRTDSDQVRDSWRPDRDEGQEWRTELAHLESTRQLIDQIQIESQGADETFLTRITAARIALDQQFVRHLDPPRERELWGWDAALEDVDWWWEGVPRGPGVHQVR